MVFPAEEPVIEAEQTETEWEMIRWKEDTEEPAEVFTYGE
jgi:hypothetical protein